MADHPPKKIRETFDQLRQLGNPKTRELLKQLDIQLADMVPAERGGVMRVESMVASKTQNPEVVFIWGNNKGILSPVQAKQYAFQILESVEASIQDAALYRAAQEVEKDDPAKGEKMGWALISMVRSHRAKFEEGGE